MSVLNFTFFTEDENLLNIIKNNIQDEIIDYSMVPTGWTNIVFDVTCSSGKCYMVRFPRNDFFSKHIEKDAIVSKFIRDRLGISTSEMELKSDRGRGFSIHEKIEGNPMTGRQKHLDKNKKAKIGKEIANVFLKFHSFPLAKLPNLFKVRFYDFLTSLPKLNPESYDYSFFEDMLRDENNEEKVFIYGDLNLGNILLDENDDVKAFIDFAFVGISDIYSDLARISCRLDTDIFDCIIDEYSKLSGKKLNMEKIENRKKMWKYVEDEYIRYMKHEFPNIKV